MARHAHPKTKDTPPGQAVYRFVVEGELHEDGCPDIDCPVCPAVWVEDADGRQWTLCDLVKEIERRLGPEVSRVRVTVEVVRT
ncbi:MAG: hypothetical protein ACE5IZ_09070 [Dehalococcoidia bacterium]